MCVYKIDEIAERVKPIAEKYGIEKVYLFGSYARGEATEDSDVDLFISYKKLMGMFSIGGIYSDCEEIFGKSVDIVSERGIKNNLEDDYTSHLYRNILKDRVLIYEQKL